MVRICPFCKSKLVIYDRYFCSSCGNTLPAELTESGSSEKRVIRHEVKKTFELNINLKKILNPLVVIFSPLALALIWYVFLLPLIIMKTMPYTLIKKTEPYKMIDQSASKKTVASPVIVNNQNAISPNCTFLSGILVDPNLGKVVPYDVDLYMEANDTRAFLKEIVDSEIVGDSKFKDFYNLQKDNFLGSVGFFVTKSSSNYIYGIAFRLKDASDKDELSKEYSISFLDSYTVLVTEKSALEEIEDISNGLGKNLTLNPIYASAKVTLPTEGKLFILPITKNGRGFLFQLLDKKLTEEMSTIVNSFLDSKLDYAVVL